MRNCPIITIEGIDAAGKTTIATRVVARLAREPLAARLVGKKEIESYENPFVRRFMTGLKGILWDAAANDPVELIPEESWALMHGLWYRTMHEHLLESLRRQHDCLILDGWYYKFLARQVVHLGAATDLTRLILAGVREADQVFLLDLPAEVAWTRRAAFRASELGAHGGTTGSAQERFVTYQEEVRQQFLLQASRSGWEVVPAGDANIDAVVERVAQGILSFLTSPA